MSVDTNGKLSQRAVTRLARLVSLCALLAVCTAGAGSCAATGPGEQTGYLRIRSAHIVPINSEVVQLEIETDGDIPLRPNRILGYVWMLDTDCNSQTGRRFGNRGYEYNIRATYRDGEWQGHIDRLPENPNTHGRGIAPVFIDGARVIARVARYQIDEAKQARWQAGVLGSQFVADEATALSKNTSTSGSPVDVLIAPHAVSMRNGLSKLDLTPLLILPDGSSASPDKAKLRLFALNPDLLHLKGTSIEAVPGAVGETSVTACADGIVSNSIRVRVGSVFIEPAVLNLDPRVAPSGQLRVTASDAFGKPVSIRPEDISYRAHDESVVTVSKDGKVTAKQWEAHTTVSLAPNGIKPDNHCFVQTNDTSAAVPLRTIHGTNSVLWLPTGVSLLKSGEPVDRMYSDYACARIADIAYCLEAALAGIAPSEGRVQHYVAVGSDNEENRLCGISGNPILLGFLSPPTPVRNAIELEGTGSPHWGVWFHELGHNVWGASEQFRRVFGRSAHISQAHTKAYVEGFATIAKVYALNQMLARRDQLGLSKSICQSLSSERCYGSMEFDRRRFGDDLAKYVGSGADYNKLDPNIVDGFLIKLADQYGWDGLPRFCNCLLTPEVYPEDMVADDADQAMFLVAALSTAYGKDLKPYFHDTLGFPVKEGKYKTILSLVQEGAKRGEIYRKSAAGVMDAAYQAQMVR